MSKLKVCVVGLGRAGHFHLSTITTSDKFQLVVVVDPSLDLATLVADKHNCKPYASFEEALSKEMFDVVVVASPTGLHQKQVLQALNADKQVFCEKPLGNNIEEIEQCFALAEEKDLALYIGFQRRYDASFMGLKARMAELGGLRMLKASSRDNPRPPIEYLRTSNHIFHDMLIHDFDMLTFLFGAMVPDKVTAYGHAHDADIAEIEDYDTVLVNVQYPNGMICSIDSNRLSPYGYDQRLELFGDKGMGRVENQLDDHLQIATVDGFSNSPANASFPQRYKDAYKRELEMFAEGLEQGVKHNVTKQECVIAHLLADAAWLAAKEQRVVQFKEQFKEELERCL